MLKSSVGHSTLMLAPSPGCLGCKQLRGRDCSFGTCLHVSYLPVSVRQQSRFRYSYERILYERTGAPALGLYAMRIYGLGRRRSACARARRGRAARDRRRVKRAPYLANRHLRHEGGRSCSSARKRGTISTSTRWATASITVRARRRGHRLRAQLQPAGRRRGNLAARFF
jgi:hypothetical protein